MEDVKKSSHLRLPPWPKRALELTSFSAMPPSILPLAPISFQGWKKPYSINSTVTKSPFNLSDAITIPSSSTNENNKKSQNISFPFGNKNNSTTKDLVAPAIPSFGEQPVKTQAMTNGTVQIRSARAIDPNMDPKKLKRVISNRASAQKSRLKKLQYLTDIERKVKALEDKIAVLSPQVALYRSHHRTLKMEQKRLNMEMSAQTSNKLLKDVEIEENKAEVGRLRQLHLTQQQEVMLAGWENGFDQQMAVKPNMFQLSMERMACMPSNRAKNGESTEGANKMTNQLKMKQHADGWRSILGWDPSEQEMANPSSHQFGSPTVLLHEKLNMNPMLGGIEQMMTFDSKPINQDLDN